MPAHLRTIKPRNEKHAEQRMGIDRQEVFVCVCEGRTQVAEALDEVGAL